MKDYANQLPASGTYEPEAEPVEAVVSDGPRLLHETEPDFIFFAKPGRYMPIQVDDKGTYEDLPFLKKLKLVPGENGIQGHPTRWWEPTSTARARSRLTQEGWIEIRNEEIDGGYKHRYQTRRGPTVVERWRVLKMENGQPVEVIDRAGYAGFLRWIEQTKLGGAPSARAMEARIDAMTARADDVEVQAEGSPARTRAVKARRAAIKAVQKKASAVSDG